VRYLLLLLCAIGYSAESKFIGGSDLDRFVDERLEFSLSFRNVPAAKALIWCQAPDDQHWLIRADVATKFWADLVFPVDNRYQTFIDQENGQVLQTTKKIKQKNLKQEFIALYDYRALQVHCSLEENWPIVDGLQTLFAMFYQLRGMDVALEDSLYCVLDIESQLWRVAGTVRPKEKNIGPNTRSPARDVVLEFHPLNELVPRKWKTDLLTNRFGRQGRLIVRLGPPPENLPLWLEIGGGTNPVSLKLLARKKG